MSKLRVNSGKRSIQLEKSSKLVGLKAASNKKLEDANVIKKEVLPHLGGFKVVELKGRNVDKNLDKARKKRAVEVGTHVYHADGSDRPLVPTGEIYIIFEEGTDLEEQQLVLDEYHLKLVERRAPFQIIAAVTAKSPNPIKVANYLEQVSLVNRAEPDLDALLDEYEFIAPRDNLLEHQWHLENDGFVIDTDRRLKKGADAKVVDAWKRLGNMGSSQVVVAVIDNGFDLSHPDLKGKVHKPYDLWTQSSNVIQGDPHFTHGTPCATIALASTNGSGMVGVAPRAKFMPVSGTSYSLRATEEMFNYCINNGADVISCSWGTTDSAFDLNNLKEQAIAKAARSGRNGKGCVIVYAAGNESQEFVSFYAAHPDVIAVGACTSQDEYATYSNKGREISVVAPSNGDWPLIAGRAWWDEGHHWEHGNRRFWYDGKNRGEHYKHFGGTSGATPLVAGVCALMLSANPNLTAKEVKQILQDTADKIGHPSEYINGHSRKYGYGRVNADRAVAEALRRKDGGSAPVEVQSTISTGKGLFEFNVKKRRSRGYGVQVGVFGDYGNVLIQAERLQGLFQQPVLVNINELAGRTVYKMVVGAFTSKSKANRLKKDMENEQVSGFVRRLEDFA